jgi:hypothetical protein
MAIRISTSVVNLLEARGLLPKYCARVELHIPPNQAMVLRFEVFVNDEHFRTLSEAFAALALEAEAEAKNPKRQ